MGDIGLHQQAPTSKTTSLGGMNPNDPESTNDLFRPRTFSTFVRDREEGASTVIIGAGIIGCATAHYLSRSPSNTGPDGRRQQIHLIEASEELFASASGKAGGFLAEDWFDSATAELGALSYRLHRELAEEYGGEEKWGYSSSTGSSLVFGPETGNKESGSHEDWLAQGGSRAEVANGRVEHYSSDISPSWIKRRAGDKASVLTEQGGVAQVNPLRLSQHLLRTSILSGVRLHHPARAVSVSREMDGSLSGVRIAHANGTEHKIPCTRLLITAGAWTPRIFEQLFPHSPLHLPISSLAGHSLVVKSPRWTKEQESQGCHAIFASPSSSGASSSWSPEIFSRVGEEIYIAGLNSPTTPLPDLPGDAKPDPAQVAEVKRVTQRLLGDDMQVIREGLCFRPVTATGNPILARIKDEDLGGRISTLESPNGGVFVCAGHGPWGISLSLGTGLVMSEMLVGKEELSCDVRGLGIR